MIPVLSKVKVFAFAQEVCHFGSKFFFDISDFVYEGNPFIRTVGAVKDVMVGTFHIITTTTKKD